MKLLRLELPLKLPSAGNLHEHWRARASRVKAQRAHVKLALKSIRYRQMLWDVAAEAVNGHTAVCTLTRISPRKLDSDNLAFAFKAVRDEIAAQLGIDDGSDAVLWEYRQETGKQAIRIEIARRELLNRSVLP